MSPDIVLGPGFVLLAPRLPLQRAFSYEGPVSFHPGGGAPGTGQQRQRDRRQGLSTLQERDLRGGRGGGIPTHFQILNSKLFPTHIS